MRLETENSDFREEATDDDLVRIFDDDDARGDFVILTADDGSFLQAAGKGWLPRRSTRTKFGPHSRTSCTTAVPGAHLLSGARSRTKAASARW
jgi:hypothetical protein